MYFVCSIGISEQQTVVFFKHQYYYVILLFSSLITVAIETEHRKFFFLWTQSILECIIFDLLLWNYLLHFWIFSLFFVLFRFSKFFCFVLVFLHFFWFRFCQHNLDSCCLTHSEFIACCSVLFSAYILFPFILLCRLILPRAHRTFHWKSNNSQRRKRERGEGNEGV